MSCTFVVLVPLVHRAQRNGLEAYYSSTVVTDETFAVQCSSGHNFSVGCLLLAQPRLCHSLLGGLGAFSPEIIVAWAIL